MGKPVKIVTSSEPFGPSGPPLNGAKKEFEEPYKKG
jgi:hypothetical protein